jgi:hypothetical protein
MPQRVPARVWDVSVGSIRHVLVGRGPVCRRGPPASNGVWPTLEQFEPLLPQSMLRNSESLEIEC